MADSSETPAARGRIGVPIPEECYKADAELLGQYQSYSAELLRLSLLGIAAIGFLLKDVALGDKTKADFLGQVVGNAWLVIGAAVALLLSAGAALAHRIASAEAFACMLLFLRCTDPGHPAALDAKRADQERGQFRTELRWASRYLIASAWFLGLGVLFLVAAFVVVLAGGRA